MEKTQRPQIQLDNWQQDVMDYKGDFLLCTGRRVGKTYIMAVKSAEYMIKNKQSQIVVVSLTEDQAKLIIAMTLNYLSEHYKPYISKGLKKPTQGSIHLNNGSSILARPVGNTGDAVRGFQGDVLIVDEAARMPEMMWIAARPILLTTGGEVWMCSTPFGKKGYFWESFDEAYNKKDPEARYKVFYETSEYVMNNRPISEVWTEQVREKAVKNLEKEKKDMSILQYGQEYLGLFMEDLMRYFSDEWIDKACTEKIPETISQYKDYYLGVDIARLGDDETTFEIIKRVNKENLIHVHHEIATKWLTTQTEDRIIQLNNQYHTIKKIYIDAGAGSLGVGILDHLLRNEQTKRKVEAINNRKLVLDREGKTKQRLLKEDLYDNLKSLGEKGQIHLLDDEKVRASLRSIQYEFIKKANQATQMRIFGNYSHIVEGLIRAAWCNKEKQINSLIYSFKP